MTEYEACDLAAAYLKQIGFEHRYTSRKSEACYYGMPGKESVLRVAAHRYGGQEWGMMPVIECLTFTARQYAEIQVAERTAAAVGHYFLRGAGIVPLTAKERARRSHHARVMATILGIDERGRAAEAARSNPI